MIPFALAHELKNAGFSPSKNSNAVYTTISRSEEKTRFACGTEINPE